MKIKIFSAVIVGLILSLAIHIYFNGLTSTWADEDLGHGLLPSDHYNDIKDFAFNVIKSLFLFIFTVLGIVFNIIWIESARGKLKNFWSLLTLRPLLISPIVFYSVYLFASRTPDSFVAMLFSFQSGFFWQSVLASRKLSQS